VYLTSSRRAKRHHRGEPSSSGSFLPLADSKAVCQRPRKHFLTPPPSLPTSLKVSSTGNGLVVPSSSHKREVAGSIPAGCTKTFLSPLPLLPHRLMSYFDVGRHLSFHENPHKTSQQQDNSSTRPRGEKKVLPLQSTGEERKEEINFTVQLVACQYWYKL
jgi:hypothetical protein